MSVCRHAKSRKQGTSSAGACLKTLPKRKGVTLEATSHKSKVVQAHNQNPLKRGGAAMMRLTISEGAV